MANFKNYSDEDFKTLPKGCYLVLIPKQKKSSTVVFIYEGHCFNQDISEKIKTLDNCFLQKYREIDFNKESELDEFMSKKKIKSLMEIVKREEKIQEKKSPKKKLTEQEQRRKYYDEFDKKKQDGFSRSSSGKVYTPKSGSIKINGIIT